MCFSPFYAEVTKDFTTYYMQITNKLLYMPFANLQRDFSAVN